MKKIIQLATLFLVLFGSTLVSCSQEDETLDELIDSSDLCAPFDGGEDDDNKDTDSPG